MNQPSQTYSVLIVSAAEHINRSVSEAMNPLRFFPVRRAASISAAQRLTVQQSFDLVIIDAPLPDDAGLRFALDTAGLDGTIVLLIVNAAQHQPVNAKVSPYGVFTLAKPFSIQTLQSALMWLASARERIRKLEKKTVSIEEKMEEIRLVNRAKWLLIEHRQMDESSAHRYIEKQAMDSCAPRRDIAQDIIAAYSKKKR